MSKQSKEQRTFFVRVSVLLCSGLYFQGCGGHVSHPHHVDALAQLRKKAEAMPNDAGVQHSLALAEFLDPRGDSTKAQEQFRRAVALNPDEYLLFLGGVERGTHGEPTEAIDYFLRTLEAAEHSGRPYRASVAEVAAEAIEELVEAVPHFAEQTRSRLERLAQEPGEIGEAARQVIVDILIELSFRRGELSSVETWAKIGNCPASWRVAGPFGPRELLGFDAAYDAAKEGPLEAEYDLGAGRGIQPTREHTARGCGVYIANPAMQEGGTSFSETFVEIKEAGRYTIRLVTPNSAELILDGKIVIRRDARKLPLARVTFQEVELTEGRHEVTVKITTRHPKPAFRVSLTKARTPHNEDTEFQTGNEYGDQYLKIARQMARGDAVSARETLTETLRENMSAPFLISRASVALADPLITSELRRDLARKFLRAANTQDPFAWFPEVQLARLDGEDGRVAEAATRLRRAQTRWPKIVAVPLALYEILSSRGWWAEAEEVVQRAQEMCPGACTPIRFALQHAQSQNRAKQIDQFSAKLVECDARNDVRLEYLVQQRNWEAASAELERLARFQSAQDQARVLSAALDIAKGRYDQKAIDDLLGRLSEQMPREPSLFLQEADLRVAGGKTDEAKAFLAKTLSRDPTHMADLRRVQRALGGTWGLESYRRDGSEVVREFEASKRSYDGPQVLVFDYTVVRVFDDGSWVELTHNIIRVQSQEAINDQGEFETPEGAELLALHTRKADGRKIEPDPIPGKESWSLPNLAIGDYVEFEYVRKGESSSHFPGGYLGARFYFQSFEIPFDFSQLTVIAPKAWPLVLDDRGTEPSTEKTIEGDTQVLRWTARQNQPLVREPMSVSPREFLPSVLLGYNASLSSWVESLRDALIDQNIFDPAAQRLAIKIAGTRTDALSKARNVYAWVLENIDESDDASGLAPALLASRTGNRARVFYYMLGLLGIDADLVIARDMATDSTAGVLPEEGTFKHLLVYLKADQRAWFVSTSDRGAPFGYIPPGLRGQRGLLFSSGSEVRLPKVPAGSDERSISMDVHLQSSGAARFEVVETLRGVSAVAWRKSLESIPRALLKEKFEDEYVSALVPGGALERVHIDGAQNLEAPLVLHYTFEVGSLGQRTQQGWLIPGLFQTQISPVYAEASRRTTAELITTPTEVKLDIRFHPPEGYRVQTPEANALARGPMGTFFRVTSSVEPNGLRLVRQVRIPAGRISPSVYPKFAEFCRRVDETEARKLFVVKSQ